MVTETIKELEAAKSKVAALEAALAKNRQALSSLPGQYGFSSVEAFVSAVKEAASSAPRGRASSKKSAPVKAAASAPAGKKRGKRAKITPEIKQELKSLVGQGKTGAAIAKALGISVPSVQNIKKELGLINARKK